MRPYLLKEIKDALIKIATEIEKGDSIPMVFSNDQGELLTIQDMNLLGRGGAKEPVMLTVHLTALPNPFYVKNEDLNQYELAIKHAAGVDDDQVKQIMRKLNSCGYFVMSKKDLSLIDTKIGSGIVLKAQNAELRELVQKLQSHQDCVD